MIKLCLLFCIFTSFFTCNASDFSESQAIYRLQPNGLSPYSSQIIGYNSPFALSKISSFEAVDLYLKEEQERNEIRKTLSSGPQYTTGSIITEGDKKHYRTWKSAPQTLDLAALLKTRFMHSLGITGKNITIAIVEQDGVSEHAYFASLSTLKVDSLCSPYEGYNASYDGHGASVTHVALQAMPGISPHVVARLKPKRDEYQDLFKNASIVNLSYGEAFKEQSSFSLPPNSPDEIDGFHNLLHPRIVVKSAGNEGIIYSEYVEQSTELSQHLKLPYIIYVGGIDPLTNKNIFNRPGNLKVLQDVYVCAPAKNILTTTRKSSFKYGQGTSLAAPAVSAGIAGLMEYFTGYSNEWIRECVLHSADREFFIFEGNDKEPIFIYDPTEGASRHYSNMQVFDPCIYGQGIVNFKRAFMYGLYKQKFPEMTPTELRQKVNKYTYYEKGAAAETLQSFWPKNKANQMSLVKWDQKHLNTELLCELQFFNPNKSLIRQLVSQISFIMNTDEGENILSVALSSQELKDEELIFDIITVFDKSKNGREQWKMIAKGSGSLLMRAFGNSSISARIFQEIFHKKNTEWAEIEPNFFYKLIVEYNGRDIIAEEKLNWLIEKNTLPHKWLNFNPANRQIHRTDNGSLESLLNKNFPKAGVLAVKLLKQPFLKVTRHYDQLLYDASLTDNLELIEGILEHLGSRIEEVEAKGAIKYICENPSDFTDTAVALFQKVLLRLNN